VRSSAEADGNVSISSPYVCISKEILKLSSIRINAGGGFNYALYTPGGGVLLSIEPRLGYMFYLEGSRLTESGQKFAVKIGYINYAGRAGTTDISSSGFFVQTGVAYQL
ncbi:hypothetical protein HZB08_02855, partial [Candidatus Saganbacteria bacterium]|nr:hypothetical protein [Candidatus Saganbacteria bacterium]